MKNESDPAPATVEEEAPGPSGSEVAPAAPVAEEDRVDSIMAAIGEDEVGGSDDDLELSDLSDEEAGPCQLSY